MEGKAGVLTERLYTSAYIPVRFYPTSFTSIQLSCKFF